MAAMPCLVFTILQWYDRQVDNNTDAKHHHATCIDDTTRVQSPVDQYQITDQSVDLPLLELSALPEIRLHLLLHVLAEPRVWLIAKQLVQYLCTQRTSRD